MKKCGRKLVTSFALCFMVSVMLTVTAFAASNYFSRTTVKLNAFNGGSSTMSTISSGSVLGSDPSITKAEIYCNVSTGTDPYTLYVKSPRGTLTSISGPSKSGTVTTSAFNEENPAGTWTVYIVNSGISYNGNLYPTSTVTATLKVYYNY